MAGWQPVRGRLVRHKWMCDCFPRQPAQHFQVRKPGKNKGKWFYTCQLDQNDEKKCKFFLWEDDAKLREKKCLANNTGTEEETRDEQTSDPPPRRSTPPPAYAVDAGSANAARKRGRAVLEQEDDDFGGFDQGDPGFNNELERALQAAETPRKAPRIDPYIRDAFTTPTRNLPWKSGGQANGLPTPQTEGRTIDLFPTPFANPGSSLLTPSRFKDAEEDIEGTTQDPGSQHSSRSLNTPTPARFRDGAPLSDRAKILVAKITSTLLEHGVRMTPILEETLRSHVASNETSQEASKKYLEKSRASAKAETQLLSVERESLKAQLEEQKALVRVLKDQIRDMGSQPEFE